MVPTKSNKKWWETDTSSCYWTDEDGKRCQNKRINRNYCKIHQQWMNNNDAQTMEKNERLEHGTQSFKTSMWVIVLAIIFWPFALLYLILRSLQKRK